ncbi:uncharacterized protein LOC135289180 isoform X2 [Passer domesticus]|uniref:uncharacterized protein LOC135289180 isoform X2 n=1 Tax=Passer domesticus TaxID=48849 RepID=UPI0030FE34FD
MPGLVSTCLSCDLRHLFELLRWAVCCGCQAAVTGRCFEECQPAPRLHLLRHSLSLCHLGGVERNALARTRAAPISFGLRSTWISARAGSPWLCANTRSQREHVPHRWCSCALAKVKKPSQLQLSGFALLVSVRHRYHWHCACRCRVFGSRVSPWLARPRQSVRFPHGQLPCEFLSPCVSLDPRCAYAPPARSMPPPPYAFPSWSRTYATLLIHVLYKDFEKLFVHTRKLTTVGALSASLCP